MLLEAIDRPFRFHFADGIEVRLAPGHPVRLNDDRAQRLLNKAGTKVRVVSSPSEVVIDPAAGNARPVFWEDVTGSLQGPARPEFLAITGTGSAEPWWVVLTYHESIRWVRADRLRSCQAYEAQNCQ